MHPRLRATVHNRLDSIGPDDWRALFANHPDSYEMIRLVQASGMNGFSFHSIVVHCADAPVLLLPLFNAALDLKSLLEGTPARIAAALARLFPSVMSPRILGIGFVEGEWGAVGVRPGLANDILDNAWHLAFESLATLAKKLGTVLTLLLNFTPRTLAAIPVRHIASFARIDTLPCGRLSLPYASEEEYLASLSKTTRKDIRRKLKAAASVQIRHVTDPSPWLHDLYTLYLATVERADMSLGTQRIAYFRDIGHAVPGTFFVLYFSQDRLVAFNLLVAREGALIDKYFCMDEKLGPELNLYFVSWIQNVRHCIDQKIPLYHAGPGAEATKARLGATFVPSITLFRGAGPILHFFLAFFRGHMAYKPAVDLTDPAVAPPDQF